MSSMDSFVSKLVQYGRRKAPALKSSPQIQRKMSAPRERRIQHSRDRAAPEPRKPARGRFEGGKRSMRSASLRFNRKLDDLNIEKVDPRGLHTKIEEATKHGKPLQLGTIHQAISKFQKERHPEGLLVLHQHIMSFNRPFQESIPARIIKVGALLPGPIACPQLYPPPAQRFRLVR